MQSFFGGENKVYDKRCTNGESNQDELEEVKIAHKEARGKIKGVPGGSCPWGISRCSDGVSGSVPG